MSVVPALVMATLIYSVYGYIIYNPAFKGSNGIVGLGLLCALLANTVWILLARNTSDSAKLFQYGMYWDTIIVSTSIFVPILLFGVRLSYLQAAGLAIALLGLFIMKAGSLR